MVLKPFTELSGATPNQTQIYFDYVKKHRSVYCKATLLEHKSALLKCKNHFFFSFHFL